MNREWILCVHINDFFHVLFTLCHKIGLFSKILNFGGFFFRIGAFWKKKSNYFLGILMFHKPSLRSYKSHTKFGPDRFSLFRRLLDKNRYTNRQTGKQTFYIDFALLSSFPFVSNKCQKKLTNPDNFFWGLTWPQGRFIDAQNTKRCV